MANFGEQRRDPSDDFKAAAYEAAQLKRSKNAKELNEKERPVRSGRETLEDANKEASTTLEKFKGTKEEKEKIIFTAHQLKRVENQIKKDGSIEQFLVNQNAIRIVDGTWSIRRFEGLAKSLTKSGLVILLTSPFEANGYI